MLGSNIAVAKRRVALFCAALCLALCAQLSIAMLERLQHAFGIQHAPNILAGEFDLGHKNHHADEWSAPHHHDDGLSDHDQSLGHHHQDESFPDDGQPVAHHHHGGGVFVPWIVSASIDVTMKSVPAVVHGHSIGAHPDAATWRRERPPKSQLESLA